MNANGREFEKSAAVERFQRRLPPLLSVVAGMVDVIGYLGLKVFTAHVTGNLVLIAALVVRGGPPTLDEIMAVPVFVLAVAGVWLISKALNKRGAALAKPLLMTQFLLLVAVLVVAAVYDPAADPRGVMADITAAIVISAMACQYSLLRLAMPVAPSTAVMTGNLTNAVLAFLDTMWRRRPLLKRAEERLRKTLQLLIGFFFGCMAGTAAILWLGKWAWSFPVVLAGLAVVLAPRIAAAEPPKPLNHRGH